mmetsp:Transcript_12526/g.24030  ORF Transcript_12526/g.24030 Transcript_12526/m.24030 type:complete len:334 (+) Transcript_12526:273-1274(+)|eukprot:scaffold7349_cov173-Amphora_coffeaeformis.AAC.65
MKAHNRKSSSSIVSTSSADADTTKDVKQDLKKKNESNANTLRKRTSPRHCEARPKPTLVRAFVEHHYHDHARDPLAKPVELTGPRSDSVMSRSFPEKLHQLLEAMDEEGTEHVVSWQPHGRCFVIHEKTEFVDVVMPRFFMQTKLTSFQRQLNLYGFIRLTTGEDRGGYYHEFFLRGRPDLCRHMVRTRVKGIGMKAASSPATEPDFYSFESCPPKGSINKIDIDGDDCDDSVSSHDKDPQTNIFDGGLLPNIVSPPESPVLSSSISIVQLAEDVPFDLLDLSTEVTHTSDEVKAVPPHTGDEVFFEGNKFRYLDHLDIDDVHDITVANVEYL